MKCRNCKSKNLEKVIFLGKQVVSSIFPEKKKKNSKKYSLDLYECKKCNNYEDFTKCYIPYSCKLLLQELMTMSISPRLLTN